MQKKGEPDETINTLQNQYLVKNEQINLSTYRLVHFSFFACECKIAHIPSSPVKTISQRRQADTLESESIGLNNSLTSRSK